MSGSGTLFVVATPIGNLEDLTFRALRTLKEVDLIAAEDTRRTAKLLAHYEIRTSMVSLHEHNEYREAPRLIGRLLAGESIALVSDAGTPAIADPGAGLVDAARKAGIRVVPIPGPSAITAALSASGIRADSFVFMGFVPRSGTERQEWFDRVAMEPGTVVFFETPHRVERTAEALASALVDRQVIWFRELTKIHETSGLRPINTSATALGEFVGVISPAVGSPHPEIDANKAHLLIGQLTQHSGISEDDALLAVAQLFKSRPSAVRKAIKKHKISAKQQNGSIA